MILDRTCWLTFSWSEFSSFRGISVTTGSGLGVFGGVRDLTEDFFELAFDTVVIEEEEDKDGDGDTALSSIFC